MPEDFWRRMFSFTKAVIINGLAKCIYGGSKKMSGSLNRAIFAGKPLKRLISVNKAKSNSNFVAHLSLI
jgi:hypothetical protein